MKKKQTQKAFTLLEVLIATVLLGIAISALMAANGAFTMVNKAGLDLSNAEFLIEQIREMTTMDEYSSLSALDDTTYSPPVDASGSAIDAFSDFSQRVTVQNVHENNFQQIEPDGGSDFLRITVEILHGNDVITEASWIRASIPTS